jgi:hypothetical protein
MNIELIDIGDYVVLEIEPALFGLKKFKIEQVVASGITDMRNLKIEFRYSFDNSSKSAWVSSPPPFEKEFPDNRLVKVDVRITRVGTDSNGVILITDIKLDYDYYHINTKPKTKFCCSDCVSGGYYVKDAESRFCLNTNDFVAGNTEGYTDFNSSCIDWSPYDIACVVDDWQRVNEYISNLYGIEVIYHKAIPDKNSTDYILKEDGIYKISDDNVKCLKVIVPQNNFPDANLLAQEFGYIYEPEFEVLIDYRHWISVYGAEIQPDKRDYLEMKINDREYMVSSAYLERKLNQAPAWYKLNLVKREKMIHVIESDIESALTNQRTVSIDEVIGAWQEYETTDIRNKSQSDFETYSKSIFTEKFDENLLVLDEFLLNNYTEISRNTYDMSSVYNQFIGDYSPVVYNQRATLKNNDLSFFCWFQPIKDAVKPNSIGGRYIERTELTDTIDITFRVVPKIPIGGLVRLENFGTNQTYFDVVDIVDKTLKLKRGAVDSIGYTNTSIVHQCSPITLIDGYAENRGFRVDVVDLQYLRIRLNSYEKWIDFGYTLPESSVWFAPFIQYISHAGQLQVDFWRMSQIKENTFVENTTKLVNMYKNVFDIGYYEFDLNKNWSLVAGPNKLTNIRLLKYAVSDDKQENLLNLMYIKDSHQAIILDNAKPRYDYTTIK